MLSRGVRIDQRRGTSLAPRHRIDSGAVRRHGKGIPKMAGKEIEMGHCIRNCTDCHTACLETVSYCLERGGQCAEAAHLNLLLEIGRASCRERVCQYV